VSNVAVEITIAADDIVGRADQGCGIVIEQRGVVDPLLSDGAQLIEPSPALPLTRLPGLVGFVFIVGHDHIVSSHGLLHFGQIGPDGYSSSKMRMFL
jgi:hypothetical protein